MSLVGRRIDVDVREYMVHRHANPDAGNLGSPEEVPVLIDLEVFIPANRPQDVAMCYETVTNECALGNVADASVHAGGCVVFDHEGHGAASIDSVAVVGMTGQQAYRTIELFDHKDASEAMRQCQL